MCPFMAIQDTLAAIVAAINAASGSPTGYYGMGSSCQSQCKFYVMGTQETNWQPTCRLMNLPPMYIMNDILSDQRLP